MEPAPAFRTPARTDRPDDRPAPDPADEALLAAIRTGDADALGRLYDRYGRLAFAVAYRVLDERGAAEDAVQDAFLAVWQRAATFRAERGSVRAWLLTITRNAAVDRRRGRHAWSQRDTPLEAVAFRLATGSEDTFAVAAAAVDAEGVRAALAALPPEQRDVIELAYDNGLTHLEIAARTGVSLGTVKGRMRLGLQRLRTLLTPAPPAGSPPPGQTAGSVDRSAPSNRAGASPPRSPETRRPPLRFGLPRFAFG